MSIPALVDSDAFARIEEVADLFVQGLSEYQIARRLGIKVIEARAGINQYQEILRHNSEATDAAKDHLNKMVVHYDYLISKARENLAELDTLVFDEKVSAQKNATMKNIADFEAKRVDVLQKAGLLEAGDLGDELAEREQREALLIDILRNHLCDECRAVVAVKLQEVTNTVEATVVYDD